MVFRGPPGPRLTQAVEAYPSEGSHVNTALKDWLFLAFGAFVALVAVVNGIIMLLGPVDRDYSVLWPRPRRKLPDEQRPMQPIPRRFFGIAAALFGSWILTVVVLMALIGIAPANGTPGLRNHQTPGYGWVSYNLVISLATIGFGAYLLKKPERVLEKHVRPTTALHKRKVQAVGVLAIAMGVFWLFASILR